MKHVILAITAIILLYNANAQVAISSNGAQPHPSAILDLKSSNKGILLPRVSLTSTTDSITILHPETSLIVYNTNPQLEAGLGFIYGPATIGSR